MWKKNNCEKTMSLSSVLVCRGSRARVWMRGLMLAALVGCLGACRDRQPVADHQVFRYNEAGNLLSLDPAFARLQSGVWATRQVFSGLVRLDTSAHPVPEVARRWSISDDGLDYTFILRDDVYFHRSDVFLPDHPDSTRAVTAGDFAYSLGRLTDPQVASPGAWTMNYVERVQAVDDTTLHIRLKEAFPAFLSLLAMPYCMVVPHEAVEKLGADFRTRPVGTGAFYVKYWSEGNMLVLRRNPYFFQYDDRGRRLPYLEAVDITFLPDKQSAFMEFLMGNLDFISGLDPGYADEVLTPEGRLKEKFEGRIAMMTMPYLNTEYLGIKMDLPSDHPLSDVRIRRALNHGFDRRKMMLYLRKNIGVAATGGMIPLGLDGTLASDSLDLYDPQLSLALIEDYRREKGPVRPFVLQVNSDYRDLCEYIQSEWQRLGLPVSVEVIQTASLRQAMATGKADFFRASWVGDYPDGENYLSLFYGPNESPKGPNYTHYANAAFDRLYLQAVHTADPDRRAALYRRADSLAMSDVPAIVLFYDQVIRFYNPALRDFTSNITTNNLDLRAVKKE